METGKQQAKPIVANILPEIQPAFRNLDIGQLVQGKTLTVGNLLEWQRTVVQAVENAKSGAPISLISGNTAIQPKIAVPPKAIVQAGLGPKVATSVPVIKGTNVEQVAMPVNRPLTTVLTHTMPQPNMTNSVLNSMIKSVVTSSLGTLHLPGLTSQDKFPEMSQSVTSPVYKQSVVPSATTSQQVTSIVTSAAEGPTVTTTETTKNTSPAPSKSLFKLSGRTLVTILPTGSGDGKVNSSHKIFVDDAFTPLDSLSAGALEASSPTSSDVKMTEKITLSPRGIICSRVKSESDESNTNKNNNNSTVNQPVNNVKHESGNVSLGDTSSAAHSSKKGKTSSRGRSIKASTLYTENSDLEDDDVFLANAYKPPKSSKSKRSARRTNAHGDSESEQEAIDNVTLYSIHMTSSGTWFHQIMWDGQRITVMVPSKEDPYFTPPKDDPPVAFEGEPTSSYSSLWKGYSVLGEVRTKLFSSFSTAAVVSFRYRSGMETVRVPLLWVPILRSLGSLQESGHFAKVLRMDHLKYFCKHYDFKFLDELNHVCQNKVKDSNNRIVIEMSDSKSDDLDYEKVPVCDFFIDRGSKKRKKSMQSSTSASHTPSLSSARKHSRNNDDRPSSRQKSACMECQAVFYADMSTCTYCDSELKKITPDQAKNCLNCGEMIRKRCRKCPFCHYNYGIFTFGRWLCNHCSRCNTARTPACLGCGREKPASRSGGYLEEQPTPSKPSKRSSKVSTSSSVSSPPRAAVATENLASGTQSPLSGGSPETSPVPPPRKRPRRGIMSVDLPPAATVDEITPMEVSTTKEEKDATVCMYRNVKWGSDEVSVVVDVDGKCLMCFPEICEKIMLDHSTEALAKKANNLKIQLVDDGNIVKELQTSHAHDTPSRTCQMIKYQDLLLLIKHFNYKVPESFERAVNSLETEASNAELECDTPNSQDTTPVEEPSDDDKELLECMTALQQVMDPRELCQLVSVNLDKSNELLSGVMATMNALDGELELVRNEQFAKRSLCEVLSSEIGFLKRRSLNIMEAIVQIDHMRCEKDKI